MAEDTHTLLALLSAADDVPKDYKLFYGTRQVGRGLMKSDILPSHSFYSQPYPRPWKYEN